MRRFALLAAAVIALAANAQQTGHYVNGVEGLRGASLPPPGLYYRNYNVFYSAGRLADRAGNSAPVGLDVDVWASAHRLIWITDKKILGANYGMDAIVPLVHTDFSLAGPGIRDSDWGLGDIWVEPILLAWHGSRWDAAFGLGFYAPTGNFDVAQPALPGKGFWTGMATFGGTVFFDPAKQWSLSLLGRYEIHSRNNDTNITPGHDFHFEWGVGKQWFEVPPGQDALAGPPKAVWELGASGYCQWQVTDDAGPGVAYDPSVHDRIFGVGPELCVVVPSSRLMFHLRHQWEFETIDRPEGSLTAFTLTGWW